MTDITLRSIKGSPLTIAEVDANFQNLNNAIPTAMSSADAIAGISTTPKSIAPNVLVASNIVQKYASVNNIPANFAGIAKVGTDLYVGDGTSTTPYTIGAKLLYPSGSDDGPAMVAMALANNGVINLGVGIFKINSPIILSNPIQMGANTSTYFGAKLIGQGSGSTIIDTSGISVNTLKVHDTWKITGVSNSSPCRVTLNATTPYRSNTSQTQWTTGEIRNIDGSPIFIQCPSSSNNISTMEAINGVCEIASPCFYMKSVTGSTILFDVYLDAALTLPLNTTDTTKYGVFGTTTVTEFNSTANTAYMWNVRRYYGNYNYTPAIRFAAPIISSTNRGQQDNVEMSGFLLRGIANGSHNQYEDPNGVGYAIENNLTSVTGPDTKTCEPTLIRDVVVDGYQIGGIFDDCTTINFTNYCDIGCHIAIGMGYNMDQVSFYQSRFYPPVFDAGYKLKQVLQMSPVYYAPTGSLLPSQSQCNLVSFRDCTFNSIHDIFGNGSIPNIIFEGCYMERGRLVSAKGGAINIRISQNHSTEYSYGNNLLNSEVVYGPNNLRALVDGNEAEQAPKFGWIAVQHQNANNDESTLSRLDWTGNRLLANAATGATQDKGHIRYNLFDGTTSNAYRFLTLSNDSAIGADTRLGHGNYHFHGMDQMSGDDRVLHLSSYSEGTNAPARYFTIVPELYNVYQITLTNPTQFWDPSSALNQNNGNSRSWIEQHSNGSDYRCYKVKPLVFILTQDATGGRAVTFTSGYVTTGLVSSGTANQRTRLEFCWSGAKWQLKHANIWG